jgi:Flp pilus assembly protein TadD
MTAPLAHDDPQQAVTLASTLLEAGAAQRAYEVLTHALAQHPQEPILLRTLARTELTLQQWHPAAMHAYAALVQRPDNIDGMRFYALALSSLGRHSDALGIAWRAACAAPHQPLTHDTYARILYRAGHVKQASATVTRALQLNQHDPEIWVLQGMILQALGRTADSDAAYRHALILQPDHAVAMHDMALNRLKAGRLTTALNGFRGAAGLDPSLGAVARNNISLTLTRAPRRSTLLATLVGFVATMAMAQLEHQEPATGERVSLAVLAALLLGQVCLTLRLAPIRTWIDALRARPFLGLRTLHIVAAFVAAVATAISTHAWAWLDLAGPVLLVAGGSIMALGRRLNT